MKGRLLIVIGAILVGAVAVAGVAAYVAGVRRQVAYEGQRVSVAVADKDIPAGTSLDELLRDDMVTVKSVPRRYVATGAIDSTTRLKGKVAKAFIGEGEQLTESKFESSKATGSFASRISGDLRATAISIDEVKGVAGTLKPGDKVDVTINLPKEIAGEYITRTILQNIEVLSVTTGSVPTEKDSKQQSTAVAAGSSQTGSSAVRKTIVLAVPAAGVEKLVFAEKNGTIHLSLVPTKSKTVQTSGQKAPSVTAVP